MNSFVAVRTLCEFTARQGDLDLRFNPSATALEGMAGHAMVTARRDAAYESEVSLSFEFEGLTVRGRADGFDTRRHRVEEIKTYRGDLAAMPGNRRALHWAQARVYAFMLCRKLGLDQIEVSLVYYDVNDQTETVFVERESAASLQTRFEDLCRRYAAWAAQEAGHRVARDAALLKLGFPHATFRPGQRMLSEAVYKTSTAGRVVLAQAPTGIGKTVGTLFPMLKAMPKRELDKIVYLTAKGPGAALALDAARFIGSEEPPYRVLEFVAREKACEQPGKACHGDDCPLARGFFDRLPAARAAMIDRPLMDRAALRTVAAEHRVCPYFLGQEMVRWSDVIVGDYNYWFDTSALLHSLTVVNEWKVGLLVDEAHNLVERARSMYSAEITRSALRDLRPSLPPSLAPAMSRLHRTWLDTESLLEEQSANERIGAAADTTGYVVLRAMPDAFVQALTQSLAAISDHLAQQPARDTLAADGPLLEWYFKALSFARLLDMHGEHSLIEVETGDDGSTVKVRNVVPAPHLRPRWAAAATATLFSATLSPFGFYSDLLGLPEDALKVDVPSPFTPDQLEVEIVHDVSTRYAHRDRSLMPIVSLMSEQYERAPGNYLAFFSSFEYLDKAVSLFKALNRDVPVWHQWRGMDDMARREFLARFGPDGRGIGFAVLGGAFGEGIDLPGTRLVGAFIATLGLPPVNDSNEQIRLRMEAMFGRERGSDYTYLYPGITKVVQAAGRVIRGSADRGTIHLIDDRYARADVQALLPAWWRLKSRV